MVKIPVPDFHNQCSRAEKPGGCRGMRARYRRGAEGWGGTMLSLLETLVDRLIALEWSVAIGGVFTWVILAMMVAAVAGARGQSGWGFFFLSLVLSSLVGLLVLFLAPNETRLELRKLRERIEHLDRVAVVKPSAPGIVDQPTPAPPPAINQSGLVNFLMVIAFAAIVATVALFAMPRG